MKKIFLIVVMMLTISSPTLLDAQNVFYIYRNDNKPEPFISNDVYNMHYSRTDLQGNEHSKFVVQEIMTYDSIYRIPLEKIDSISFIPSECNAYNLPLMLKRQYGVTNSTSYQNDFGWPASMIFMDVRTADVSSTTSGYNWFNSGQDYTDKSADSKATYYMWYTNYDLIKTCNLILKYIDPETNHPTLRYYISQALGFRAWAYFNLAQMYQFTFNGHQDKPCVPLITEKNMENVSLEGIPRSSVQEVYDQIINDINESIKILNDLGRITSFNQYDKQFLTSCSATGIRARINLVMNKWKEAAEDAKYVIENSNCVPYSIEAISRPSFWNAEDSSWLFAICIDYGDVGNLHCWPGHFVTFYEGGYAQVNVFRSINKSLYDIIPSSDVRKGWWCDANGVSSILDELHNEILYGFFNTHSEAAYVNVKFDTYNSERYGLCYINDIPLMRIEEMWYIYAEATAMSGGDGAAILENFISRYRDPYYQFKGKGEEVQEECWRQRRIEFWGEGLAYYDLQRLKKPVNRVGGGFEPSVCFNIPAESPLRIYLIPEDEMENNPAIIINNEEGDAPIPITE